MINLAIESNCSTVSTVLTFDGLKADTTYSRFQDGYFIKSFNTDSNGKYAYTQDISEVHYIIIQEGESTIYINPDGTVSPTTAPIGVVGNTYTFTDNIYTTIIVQKDDIVIDGNGYTLQGSGSYGLLLSGRSNVKVRDVIAKGWDYAIFLQNSHSLEIKDNNAIDNVDVGIMLYYSYSNNITGNVLTRNHKGIGFIGWYGRCDSNIISDNEISSQRYSGVEMMYADNNKFYHNNFVSNPYHVEVYAVSGNVWDDGYPSGGNYWTGYYGVDSQPDGIGDTPYSVYYGLGGQDRYPLMNPWTPVETSVQVGGKDCLVVIDTNTNLNHITSTKNTLHFDSSGSTGGKGFIKIVFPMLNTTNLKVFIDGIKLSPPPFPIINTDGRYYYVYFEFMLSSHAVAIQFAPITATIDIDPDTLNLFNNGQWNTAYVLELETSYSVQDVNVSSIRLNGTIQTSPSAPVTIGDHDNDGISDLMVKFDRAKVESYILGHIDIAKLIQKRFMTVTLTMTGELNDGMEFQGSTTITIVYNKAKK
jgi:parallel beta-helix repeat protein